MHMSREIEMSLKTNRPSRYRICEAVLLSIVLAIGTANAQQGAASESRVGSPIIDMHLHAIEPDFVSPVSLPNPVTGEPGPTSGLAQMHAAMALMERYNVVNAIVSGSVDAVAAWREAAPERVLGSLAMGRPGFNGGAQPLPPFDELRTLYRDGSLVALGEITAQYEGFSPNDPGYEPYFSLAEELDIPVGVHTGTSFPGTAYRGKPNFRVSLGNPILLEDVLVRHPNLRVYLMHGGYPWDREAQAIMQQYPQVYMDISPIWLNLGNEAFESLMEQEFRRLYGMGLGERIMFGTDQMAWPKTIGMAIEMIEGSEFLSESQKRDILYNNAARFLGLSEEEVSAHHGR
jgi:predicted TIM-barrel fold metal-dependent hydrolase